MDIRHIPLKLAWKYDPNRSDGPAGVSATTTSQGPRATYRGDGEVFYMAPGMWLCLTFDNKAFVLDDLAASVLLREDKNDGA